MYGYALKILTVNLKVTSGLHTTLPWGRVAHATLKAASARAGLLAGTTIVTFASGKIGLDLGAVITKTLKLAATSPL